jgi:hypothetical protein
MQPRHYEAIHKLERCRFLPGSWDKRFVNGMVYLSEYAMLTAKQEEWIDKMLYRYRKQLARIEAKP